MNRNLIYIIAVITLVSCARNSSVESVANSTKNAVYNLPVVTISGLGKVVSYQGNCQISQNGPFNLKPVKVGDTIQNKTRLYLPKGCSLEAHFGQDKGFSKRDLNSAYDVTFIQKNT